MLVYPMKLHLLLWNVLTPLMLFQLSFACDGVQRPSYVFRSFQTQFAILVCLLPSSALLLRRTMYALYGVYLHVKWFLLMMPMGIVVTPEMKVSCVNVLMKREIMLIQVLCCCWDEMVVVWG